MEILEKRELSRDAGRRMSIVEQDDLRQLGDDSEDDLPPVIRDLELRNRVNEVVLKLVPLASPTSGSRSLLTSASGAAAASPTRSCRTRVRPGPF